MARSTTFSAALKDQRDRLDSLLRDLASAAARVQAIQGSAIYSDDYKREQEQKALAAALSDVNARIAGIRSSQQSTRKKLAAELAGPEPSWSERSYHHQRAVNMIAGKRLTQIIDIYSRIPPAETGLRRELESIVNIEHGNDRDWQALVSLSAPVELRAAESWEAKSASILANIEHIAAGLDRPGGQASLKSLRDAAEMLAGCSPAWDRMADEVLAMAEGRETTAQAETRATVTANLAAADAAKAGTTPTTTPTTETTDGENAGTGAD
jgi:hypothetical protein